MQKEVSLKGFRTESSTFKIKSRFGKSIYGEVIDKILETSVKAIEEKKLRLQVSQKLI